jgi:four helix bundle protein
MDQRKNSGKLPFAENFRDLVVYQKARSLAYDIFILTVRFPREEIFSLTDQIRRSSRSIGAQIAEAWAKRRYEKFFVSKLVDANGEQQETQHWIEIALDCQYLEHDQSERLLERCNEIGRMLGSMIAKPDVFCLSQNKSLREIPSEYQANEPNQNG